MGEKNSPEYGTSEEALLEVVGQYAGFKREAFKAQRDKIMGAPQVKREKDGKEGIAAIFQQRDRGYTMGGNLFGLELETDGFTVKTRIERHGQKRPGFKVEKGHYLVDVVVADPLSQYTHAQKEMFLALMHGRLEGMAQARDLHFDRNGILSGDCDTMHPVLAEQSEEALKKTLVYIVEFSGKIKERAEEFFQKLAPV